MPTRTLRAAFLAFAAAALSNASTPLVVEARIDTPIHPAAANYLSGVRAPRRRARPWSS
jgi:membrane-bound ClpP family serine protease